MNKTKRLKQVKRIWVFAYYPLWSELQVADNQILNTSLNHVTILTWVKENYISATEGAKILSYLEKYGSIPCNYDEIQNLKSSGLICISPVV